MMIISLATLSYALSRLIAYTEQNFTSDNWVGGNLHWFIENNFMKNQTLLSRIFLSNNWIATC